MTDKLAVIALGLSGGSLLVSLASFVLASKAKQQAQKAATLKHRTEAIDHLRKALFDTNNNGFVTRKTVDSIQKAMHLSALVFSRKVRNELDRAYATVFRLNMPPDQRTDQDVQDTATLGKDLQTLIDRMNQEGTLFG
jgi:hypothetical protein